MKPLHLLICLLSLALGAVIPPNDPNIMYKGRITSSYSFEWSGIEIGAGFTGTSVGVVFTEEQTVNMYNVFIDGKRHEVLNTTAGTKTYKLSSGLPSATHTVLITKRTEAQYGVVTFGGFVVDEGAKLTPYAANHTRRIEFVGDSITCGFGIIGTPPCGYSPPTEDNYLTYGPRIARELNAEVHVEAWSGMGMVKNWNGVGVPFPALFPYVFPSKPSEEWDFSKWVPHAVVINLGTNDYCCAPVPSEDSYETGYINFIKTYTQKYNPAPKFFLVCGPLQLSSSCAYVQKVAQATGATYVDIQNILEASDFGCAGHPGVTGHEKMANHTLPAIRAALHW